MGRNEIPTINTRLILSPKTQHGGNIIREHGKIWVVLEYRERVLAFSGKPGLLVASIVSDNWQWIRIHDDRELYWAPVGGR